MLREMAIVLRAKKLLMSAEWKAFCVESAPTPIDSRKSMAGSSLRSDFTTSIFCELSQRGILCEKNSEKRSEKSSECESHFGGCNECGFGTRRTLRVCECTCAM